MSLETNSKRKRRIMHEFRLDEISSVDKPAQAGALMTIMKRMEPVQKLIPNEEPATFEAAVAVIRKRDACAATEALRRAANEHPDLFAKFQQQGGVPDQTLSKVAAKPDAVRVFEKCTAEIAARDKCSPVTALQRARDEFPTEFRAYQSA